MRSYLSQVIAELSEDSSIPSPEWQTSGITTGAQALAGTDALTFWRGEPSTSIDDKEIHFQLIEVEEKEPTLILNRASNLRKSIEMARQELREGLPYLTHDDIFGD